MVEGGHPIEGELILQGSKNAALPMLAATLLNAGVTTLNNCPDISDVNDMIELLRSLGCKTVRNEKTVIIDASNVDGYEIDKEQAVRTRGSFLMLGALLGRTGKAKIPYPGGCPIGCRPVDIHLKALNALGMEMLDEDAEADEAVSAVLHRGQILNNKNRAILKRVIRLSYPSVGATQNVILASVLGSGEVVVKNCAREPEIVELCNMLLAMGAHIEGIGTSKLYIKSVSELDDVEWNVPGDRIAAGTYMAAAIITDGRLTVRGINAGHIQDEIRYFTEAGAAITLWDDALCIRRSHRKGKILPVKKLVTSPYPGFPTDMQSQFMSMLLYAEGKSKIKETVFENRFMTVPEFNKMGASISISRNGKTAYIDGVSRLYGSDMRAQDLRGGASLVLAALGAIGKSRISGYEHIARGYERFDENLNMLGADVKIQV